MVGIAWGGGAYCRLGALSLNKIQEYFDVLIMTILKKHKRIATIYLYVRVIVIFISFIIINIKLYLITVVVVDQQY